MARRITTEMLIDAIARQKPLFEDGDIIGTDVITYIYDNHISTKAKQAIVRNLSASKGLLSYEYVCPVCKKQHIHKLSSSRLYNVPLSFGTHHKEFIEVDNIRGCIASLIFCLLTEFDKHDTLCEECLNEKREEYKNLLKDFYYADKRVFWLILLKGKTKSEIKSFLQRHPYCSYYRNSDEIFEDDVLVDIVSIRDVLTNKLWQSPEKEADDNKKKEIYDKAYQDEKRKVEEKMIEAKARSQARRDVYAEYLTDTDRFVLKYCKPSSQDASREDLRAILNTEGLNEPQLQTSLRALLYDDFLKTIYWKALCSRRKYLDGCKCHDCGTTENLHVHHINYDHHGDERHHLEELVTLCKKCHVNVHYGNKIKRPE